MTKTHDKYVTNIIKWHSFDICSFKFFDHFFFMSWRACVWNQVSRIIIYSLPLYKRIVLCTLIERSDYFFVQRKEVIRKTFESEELHIHIHRMMRWWRKCISIKRTDRAYEVWTVFCFEKMRYITTFFTASVCGFRGYQTQYTFAWILLIDSIEFKR